MKIDLNADLGEGSGADELMLRSVSSCNIACGGHAGDHLSMRETLRLAMRAGVSCGAHPSFPDRDGFGRRDYHGSLDALEKSVSDQLANLLSIAEEEGVPLTHVKPHGALYNQAALDPSLAELIALATKGALPGLALVGPPNSAIERAAAYADLRFIAEGFADRRYLPDGRLMPRTEKGAVLVEQAEQISQSLAFAAGEPIATSTDQTITLSVQTICLHGDTPGAAQSAIALRQALEAAGAVIEAPSG